MKQYTLTQTDFETLRNTFPGALSMQHSSVMDTAGRKFVNLTVHDGNMRFMALMNALSITPVNPVNIDKDIFKLTDTLQTPDLDRNPIAKAMQADDTSRKGMRM